MLDRNLILAPWSSNTGDPVELLDLMDFNTLTESLEPNGRPNVLHLKGSKFETAAAIFGLSMLNCFCLTCLLYNSLAYFKSILCSLITTVKYWGRKVKRRSWA